MSDISQQGLIGTLQRLNDHPQLAETLTRLTADAPAVLILPCHSTDLGRPALCGILKELKRAPFLSEVLVPINGTDSAGIAAARAFFAKHLPIPHRLLWCDPLANESIPSGKGSNVWFAIGLLAKENKARYLLTADADVTTFRLEMLERLLFALAEPTLGYSFVKSYYPRVTDRIHGRVSRLFLAPLLQAIVRIEGHRPLLDFLLSFRYPLAGEGGLTLDLARTLPIETGWGLELGLLCELFHHVDPRQVAQVDAGIRYDHKHQPLGDEERGLIRMCSEIAETLFAALAREGVRQDTPFKEALLHSYHREAAEAQRRSHALAKINALHYPLEEENHAVTRFGEVLQQKLQEGPKPPKHPRLPAWDSVARHEIF